MFQSSNGVSMVEHYKDSMCQWTPKAKRLYHEAILEDHFDVCESRQDPGMPGQERYLRKTSMDNQTWRDLVYLRKYKRVLAEENRKWKDLREIAERKVDEDEAVDNMMKEEQVAEMEGKEVGTKKSTVQGMESAEPGHTQRDLFGGRKIVGGEQPRGSIRWNARKNLSGAHYRGGDVGRVDQLFSGHRPIKALLD